ncbi:hypothetical protein DL766_001067 [Monosporascus sp. MC13-8B]|uniref:Arrestin-like N-terminal domain-containing protein n=1 Tax=Monosporascus cannonballus TaxID=155416 RepID=A0ABY0H1Z9_9PEZI|nr:hypothetical protein DL762_008002 [Monosporascus cannonballus]RYO98633.1 hypothetical protein DL763_002062 [Monosporascus cannonballus]RYP38272.1 hypothetical protein DL766_001067 [Monosporascus sp. MC13-8B]
MAAQKSPAMEIHIENHYRSKIYTSSSPISGHVSINTQHDVRFDSLQILLLGTAKTRVDGVSVPQSTCHTFLKLTMPIPESWYPVPRVLEAGRTYSVPFNFVIPGQLTINACSHTVFNDAVRDYHIRLPPTVGSWDRDDLAPTMTRVEYAIKARVLQHEEGAAAATKVLEDSQEIRVLPAAPEEPPLGITENDKLYTMSKRKTMRRTILSPKLGQLTVSATQPAAAMLSPDGRSTTATDAQLDFRFEPASAECAPPQVTAISAKILAVSYFSACGVRCLPNLGDWSRHFGYEGSGSYSTTTAIPPSSSSSAPACKVAWKQHLRTQTRRDSGYGSDLPSDSDHSGEGGSEGPRWTVTKGAKAKVNKTAPVASPVYHTASLQVPIRLPTDKKMFLPTYHSCITSRAYVLWLTVSVSSGGSSSSIMLGVPLQIGVKAVTPSIGPSTGPLPPSFETAVEEAEADAYLRPRVLSAPTVEFHHQYQQDQGGAPPGYADLGPRVRAVAPV